MKIIVLLSLAIIVLAASGCSDDANAPEEARSRWVYYAVDDSAGTGLFRYGLDNGRLEKIVDDRVVYISGVARNGIVLFEKAGERDDRFWGRCEDGSIIPVPFPVHPDPKYEYVHDRNAEIVLSLDGHHAAYLVFRRPLGSTDSSQHISHLVVFDCQKGEMSVSNIGSYFIDQCRRLGYDRTNVRYIESEIHIDHDGSRVWLAVVGVKFEGQFPKWGPFGVVQWNGVAPEIIAGPDDEAIRVLHFEKSRDKLLCFSHSHMSVIGIDTRQDYRQTVYESMYFSAFIQERPERIHNGSSALWLHSLPDDRPLKEIITYSVLENSIQGEQSFAYDNVSVSPDGEWILVPFWAGSQSGLRRYRYRRHSLQRCKSRGYPERAVDSNACSFEYE